MRQELQALLEAPHLQGFLRPGCLHLTLEAVLQDPAQLAALRSLGAAGAVQQLIEGGTELGSLLQRAPALVQFEGQAVLVQNGRVARVVQLTDCIGVLPSVSSVLPIALHTGGPGRVLVRGRNLAGSQARLLVRSQADGLYPLVEVLSTGFPAGVAQPAAVEGGGAPGSDQAMFAADQEWVEIRLPGVRQGLLSVEIQRGALLSSSRPLLALDSAAAVAELRQLEAAASAQQGPVEAASLDAFLRNIGLVLHHQQLRQAASAAAGAASLLEAAGGLAAEQAAAQAAALAPLAAGAAQQGMVVTARRGWPALAALLLPSVAADGRSAADAVRAMNALCPLGSPLLLLATASKSAALIQALAAWGCSQGFKWSVATPVGPNGVTPLHVAAAARSTPLLLALHGMDPAGARAAWHTAKTADGLTPANFAALTRAKTASSSTAVTGSAGPAAGVLAAAAVPATMPDGQAPVVKEHDGEESAGPRSVLLGPATSHDTSQTAHSDELEAAAQAAAAMAAAASAAAAAASPVPPESPGLADGASFEGAFAAAAPATGGSFAAAAPAAEDGGAASDSDSGSPADSRSSLVSGTPASHGSAASLSCPPTPEGYSSRRASLDGASTGASTPRRRKDGGAACRASPRHLAKLLGACMVSLRK